MRIGLRWVIDRRLSLPYSKGVCRRLGDARSRNSQPPEEGYRSEQDLTDPKTIRLFAAVPGNLRLFHDGTGVRRGSRKGAAGRCRSMSLSQGSQGGSFGVLPVFLPSAGLWQQQGRRETLMPRGPPRQRRRRSMTRHAACLTHGA